jgi:hypothetical protein
MAAAIKKDKHLGQEKAGADLLKGGFTLDELTNYINSYTNKELGSLVDDNG